MIAPSAGLAVLTAESMDGVVKLHGPDSLPPTLYYDGKPDDSIVYAE
jgi:hypothetical protein